MSWVRHLRVTRMDGTAAYLAAAPGQRDLLAFATPTRRQKLASMLGAVLGRSVAIELDTQTDRPAADSEASETPPGDDPQAGATGVIDRSSVLRLPAVQRVLEVFEATLVGVRRIEEPGDNGNHKGSATSAESVADGGNGSTG